MMILDNLDFKDSAMNVTGVLVSAGNVYTYFDIAAGKDQPWLGPVWKMHYKTELQMPNGKCFNMNIGVLLDCFYIKKHNRFSFIS
jgi:hypothetical protein